jgi:ribosome biogenesis ATPase
MEIVALPLLHPEIYTFTGVKPPRGVLLHGVPGGGKTRLVNCLAGVGVGVVQLVRRIFH